MSYGNSDKNTEKEFYSEVARLLGVTVPTVKRYFVEGFYEVLVRMTWSRGSCTVPHLGTFTLVHEPEYYQKQKKEKGEEVIYKVPERDKPIFIPHDTFINDVNYVGVTKAYRKRLKKNRLTTMDFRRQERANEIGDFGSMTAKRIEQSKENFKELLEKKKKEKEAEASATNQEN